MAWLPIFLKRIWSFGHNISEWVLPKIFGGPWSFHNGKGGFFWTLFSDHPQSLFLSPCGLAKYFQVLRAKHSQRCLCLWQMCNLIPSDSHPLQAGPRLLYHLLVFIWVCVIRADKYGISNLEEIYFVSFILVYLLWDGKYLVWSNLEEVGGVCLSDWHLRCNCSQSVGRTHNRCCSCVHCATVMMITLIMLMTETIAVIKWGCYRYFLPKGNLAWARKLI